jgi:hypothetical protein
MVTCRRIVIHGDLSRLLLDGKGFYPTSTPTQTMISFVGPYREMNPMHYSVHTSQDPVYH